MKLIKPSFEILTPIDGEEILKSIEKVARTCYKSEDKIAPGSAEKLVKILVTRGHEAMLEFADITVKFTCDRGVSHELVRHRLTSFAQESTRYCNYGKDAHMQFIIPSFTTLEEQTLTPYDLTNQEITDLPANERIWLGTMSYAEVQYNNLIKSGWSPQEARSVLPNSLKTEINMKASIREWRHVFKLRCAPAAHPQMRELMIPLLHEFKKQIPIIFDDITY